MVINLLSAWQSSSMRGSDKSLYFMILGLELTEKNCWLRGLHMLYKQGHHLHLPLSFQERCFHRSLEVWGHFSLCHKLTWPIHPSMHPSTHTRTLTPCEAGGSRGQQLRNEGFFPSTLLYIWDPHIVSRLSLYPCICHRRPSSHHRPPTPPPPQRSAAQYSLQHTQPFRRSEDRDKARANSSHSDLLVCYFCFQQFSLSKSKLKRLWADRRAAELNQSSLKVHIKQAAVRRQLLIWTFCFVW